MHLAIRKKKFHVKILQYVEKEFVVIIIIIMLFVVYCINDRLRLKLIKKKLF